ncbi:hypothetical protein Aoki45_32920 [Algoriphagus sp. oki45]|nr:hypothetical protein Aoki45_32920 [Algoriphagus sp. oki45]
MEVTPENIQYLKTKKNPVIPVIAPVRRVGRSYLDSNSSRLSGNDKAILIKVWRK